MQPKICFVFQPRHLVYRAEVGYTDCSYFIRCYKKLKGITPKQARKLQLGR